MASVRHFSLVAVVLAITTVVSGVASADVFSSPIDPLVDGSAEQGLSGWDANGFVVAQYGQTDTPPSDFANRVVTPDVFLATTGGATLTQTVSLASLAPTIDAGDETLYAYSYLGGSGDGADGVGMTVQLLDGSGLPLGSPSQLGPASAADRVDGTLVIPCYAMISVPAGTRSAIVTLTAEGSPGQPSTGTADDIQLYTSRPAFPDTLNLTPIPYNGGSIAFSGAADGPNCTRAVFTPSAAGGGSTGGSTPTTPTDTTTSPTAITTPAPAALRAVSLTRTNLTFRVTRSARVRVTLRSLGRIDHTARRGRVQLTLSAGEAEQIVHKFRPALTPGRYSLKLHVLGVTAGSDTTITKDASIKPPEQRHASSTQ